MNYETSFFSGIPLYRILIRLHSVRNGGAEVARFGIQSATDPTINLPDTLYLTLMADGSRLSPNDAGITATLDVNWKAVEWAAAGLTAHTGMSATGIRAGQVQTAAMTEAIWLAPAVDYKRRVTVGARTGQYRTVVAAIDALTDPNSAGSIRGSTYPSSNICSPERPLLIEVVDAFHEEQVVPYNVEGIDQSPLRLPHGCALRLRQDTLIYMNAPGSSAPLIEMNFTSRIEGPGTMEQRGGGYAIHIDNHNGISRTSALEPTTLRRKIQTVLNGGLIIRRTLDDTVPNIGSGVSNGQTMLFDGIRLERGRNASQTDYIFIHNSPFESHAGRIHLRNVSSDIGDLPNIALLALGKSFGSTIQHGVLIESSDIRRLEVNNSVGGTPGFRRLSPMTGITIIGDLGE